jgi:DNA polymerase-3 subunit alpha
MEECKRMGLEVLGPDVNESHYKFTVNDNYAVRFGWERSKEGSSSSDHCSKQKRRESTNRF